jgi:ribosome-binding protein aMBF1 (putative translation factor)
MGGSFAFGAKAPERWPRAASRGAPSQSCYGYSESAMKPGEEHVSPVGRSQRRRRAQGGSTASTLERLRRRLAASDAGEEQALFRAIAHEVAQRRLEWDLSQRELADLCGTTQSAIARIERGARPPRIDTLLRIGRALDCELAVELRPRTTGHAFGDQRKERSE